MDLQLSRQQILPYAAGASNQRRPTNRLHRHMRIGDAQRELSRAVGRRFLAAGYSCVSRADWLRHYSTTALEHYSTIAPQHYSTTVLLFGAHLWYKADDALWWLEKNCELRSHNRCWEYLVRFLDDSGPIKLPVSLLLSSRFLQEVFKVPGAFNSVGVDQAHTGFKLT